MKKRQINIMPMAGDGKRFIEAGYKIPIPLIDIDGEPMFVKSAKCMPKADLWIFVMQKKILENDLVIKEIKKNFKRYEIVTVDQVTQGQASSCMLAKKYLEKDDQIFISSCDNFIEFNIDEYNEKSKKYEVLIFTSPCKKIHLKNPKAYGWIKKNNSGLIKISCKEPLSSDPTNDRIIIGTFSFQKLDFFTNSINSLFDKEVKINNEYYLDMAVNESISLGFKVDEVIVKNYISWGSHVELDEWKKNRSKTINR